MDILERIIEHLTSDEVRRFKILSNRFKADEEKKLLLLFDAIRAGDFKENEEEVIRQFYNSTGPKAKNSYYRLRNKLLSNLEKSLLFYHFNYRNSIESYANIQLSILYRERGLYREAYYNLRKAEKTATDYDQFSLLEVIYDEMVKLSAHHEVDIEEVIERRRQNLKKIDILRATSEVLGLVTQQLMKRNFARSKRSQTVIETLEQIREGLEEHQDIFQSTSGQIMIIQAVASILIQKTAYKELAEYARETLTDMEAQERFNRENHATRLKLRIWRINSLQKLLRPEEAQAEIATLHEELQMYRKQYFGEFAFNYYAAQTYNLKLLGDLTGAGQALAEALTCKDILRHEVQELYLLISLADQHFSQGQHAEAVQALRRIRNHHGYQVLDEELRFYVHVFEVVNLYESAAYAKAATAFKALRRQYRALLRDDFYAKASRFLDIVMRLNKAAQEGRTVFLRAAYRNFVRDFPPSEIGDNQIIMYEVYLQAKLEEKPYYELLCALVPHRAQ